MCAAQADEGTAPIVVMTASLLLLSHWRKCGLSHPVLRSTHKSFGDAAGNESHAGQVFTCVGALALAGALEHVDADLLSWWCGFALIIIHWGLLICAYG